MRYLMFNGRFATPIRQGTKDQTIRKRFLIKEGETFIPRQWEGRPYGRQSRQIAIRPPVVARRIRPIQVEVMLDGQLVIVIDGRRLAPWEVDSFARCDGFRGAVDMAAYYLEKERHRFEGELCRWSDPEDGRCHRQPWET